MRLDNTELNHPGSWPLGAKVLDQLQEFRRLGRRRYLKQVVQYLPKIQQQCTRGKPRIGRLAHPPRADLNTCSVSGTMPSLSRLQLEIVASCHVSVHAGHIGHLIIKGQAFARQGAFETYSSSAGWIGHSLFYVPCTPVGALQAGLLICASAVMAPRRDYVRALAHIFCCHSAWIMGSVAQYVLGLI